MTRTTQDLVNSLTRPVRHYRIKIVPDSIPNAMGVWVDCGTHQFPPHEGFKTTASRLEGFCPPDCHIVQIESR